MIIEQELFYKINPVFKKDIRGVTVKDGTPEEKMLSHLKKKITDNNKALIDLQNRLYSDILRKQMFNEDETDLLIALNKLLDAEEKITQETVVI